MTTLDRAGMDRALAAASDTRIVVVRPGALASAGSVFRNAFAGGEAIIVADETTYEIAGRALERSLAAGGRTVCPPLVFPSAPPLTARYENVERVAEALRPTKAIAVAVGAGTINDLTKLASHQVGRHYMAVATAASMDGYAAFGAAITQDGFKRTIGCRAPRAILADVDILVAAPREMTASGFGDLIGKITAGADWLVADAVGAEPLDRSIWSMVQRCVREVLAEPASLAQGDPRSVERLFLGLTMTGLAMQAARSSRPASGSEHQFSHLWEMTAHDRDVSHGFKVGIGTIAVGALYEQLLARDLDRLPVDEIVREWPTLDEIVAEVRRIHADAVVSDQAVIESRAKYISAVQLRSRLEEFGSRWSSLRHQLRAQLLRVDELRSLLATAGCPIDPRHIGIDLPALRASYAAARTIRRRYTILDLAVETGTLAPSLDELFGRSGSWGAASENVGSATP
jgi:glycerol-1-phosphate dehydrogenase [NAD(P)+]